MLLLSLSAAQNADGRAATLQDILVVHENGELRMEVVLSAPVKAFVTTERHPDRLLLQLPNTTDGTKHQKIEVNSNGVRTIHTQFAYEDSQSTNIVIELDHARPYTFRSESNRLILTVAESRAHNSENAPPAAVGVPIAASAQNNSNSKSAVSPSSAAATARAVSFGVPTKPAVTEGSSTAAVSTKSDPTLRRSAAVSSSNATVPPRGPAGTIIPAAPIPQTVQPGQNAHTEVGSQQASSSSAIVESPSDAGSNPPQLSARSAVSSLRTVFKVKYVAEGVAYVDGGRSSGLKEGVKLEVQETDLPAHEGAAVAPSDPRIVAELVVTAVAETSAVTDVSSPKRPLKAGDLAYLSSSDAEALVQQTALSPTRKYPAVVSFTEGDTLDDEVREEVPRPPLPSVNRARGRFGFDTMTTISHGTNGMTSSDFGMVFRGDITRINGTYWDLSGYWRGRFTSQTPAGQQTLQDLLNRTYHLNLTYDNPNSSWVAGFGRLYLPWASSLDTIDGGYFGRRLSKSATLGIFGGSTPDPTSYDYSPDRVIGGSFINFEGGDYSKVHYSSTWGGGISMLKWQLDKPFGFAENVISYTQRLSVYDAVQVDSPSGNAAVAAPGMGLSRNFFTFRVQPHPRLELDFNHTYFRDIPTFDPTLIGTGLLDKYLFQGFSVGARVEVKKQVFVYTQLGRSSRTGDANSSLNQLYGITFGHLPWFGLRADFHYAQFSSSFGTGSYKALSVSRTFSDNLRLEVLAGKQSFSSLMTTDNGSWFVTSNVETNLGSHYFIQGNYTVDRGQFSYDQWGFTLGYRFDSKARHGQ